MPRGFSSKSAEKFFTNTGEALEKASQAHNRNPFENHQSRLVPLPNLPTPTNVQPPFSPEEAWTGAPHGRNAGNSSNIVADSHIYEQISRQVDMIDDQAGYSIYKCCNDIETMCANIFIVPSTVSQINNFVSQVKNSMGTFRSLTEEVNICARKFTHAIADIDHGSMNLVAKSRQGAEQAIRRVSDSMDRQIQNMERTVANYNSRAEMIQNQAERRLQRVENTLDRIENRLDRADQQAQAQAERLQRQSRQAF